MWSEIVLSLGPPDEASTSRQDTWFYDVYFVPYENFIYAFSLLFLFFLLIIAIYKLTGSWKLWTARVALASVIAVTIVEFYQLHPDIIRSGGIRSILVIAGIATLSLGLVRTVEWCLAQLASATLKSE